jgi:hypothetical protein
MDESQQRPFKFPFSILKRVFILENHWAELPTQLP